MTTPKPSRVKKLSPKTILGDVKKAPFGSLFIIAGKANSIITGDSNYGEWQALKGSFRAINSITGEIKTSNTLFLPEVGHDMVVEGLLEEDVNVVEFALEIGKEEDDSSATGYIFTVNSLIEPEPENDPLAQLLAKAGGEKLAATRAIEHKTLAEQAEKAAKAAAEKEAKSKAEAAAKAAKK